eukprot:6254646-Amphidinium_carterae.1
MNHAMNPKIRFKCSRARGLCEAADLAETATKLVFVPIDAKAMSQEVDVLLLSISRFNVDGHNATLTSAIHTLRAQNLSLSKRLLRLCPSMVQEQKTSSFTSLRSWPRRLSSVNMLLSDDYASPSWVIDSLIHVTNHEGVQHKLSHGLPPSVFSSKVNPSPGKLDTMHLPALLGKQLQGLPPEWVVVLQDSWARVCMQHNATRVSLLCPLCCIYAWPGSDKTMRKCSTDSYLPLGLMVIGSLT